MLKMTEGFHHWVTRRIVGKTDMCMVDREWEFPPVSYALEILGMWTIKEYIQRQQDAIAVHIVCWSIYELYTGA